MNTSFIVRRGAELKAAGATVLQAALSIELVVQVLGTLKKRKRFYDPVTTWLTFLGQTLATDHSCRNAVSQARAAGVLSAKASVHTGAYCQARERLPEDGLHQLATGLGAQLTAAEREADRWHGRRVLVADGSSVALPDTKPNQAAYPQPSAQAPGCGFPVMYLCALLSLASGSLLDFTTGNGNGNELALWRHWWIGCAAAISCWATAGTLRMRIWRCCVRVAWTSWRGWASVRPISAAGKSSACKITWCVGLAPNCSSLAGDASAAAGDVGAGTALPRGSARLPYARGHAGHDADGRGHVPQGGLGRIVLLSLAGGNAAARHQDNAGDGPLAHQNARTGTQGTVDVPGRLQLCCAH